MHTADPQGAGTAAQNELFKIYELDNSFQVTDNESEEPRCSSSKLESKHVDLGRGFGLGQAW